MLFSSTSISGLFCFENKKEIFENVHRSFKFVVLTFEKGKTTQNFPAAFMRHNVEELERFPSDDSVTISVDLVKKLSPDSLSIMEFKNDTDIVIAKKMLKFPLLGQFVEHAWHVNLTAEFHMTNDSKLFKQKSEDGRLPLYEGKMIWQFDHKYAVPKYWIDEEKGRKELINSRIRKIKKVFEEHNIKDEILPESITLDYETYRFGFRDIAASTNERAMICAILPPKVFAGNTINLLQPRIDIVIKGKWFQALTLSPTEMVYVCSVFNSFILDWMIRQKITSHLNMYYIYQLPVPRLVKKDKYFDLIVSRAAKLICTTKEFDDLAKNIGLGSHKNGVIEESARAKLRAELDGIIAHLYGLTEEEFAYILTTFPIVKEEVKQAALQAFRDVEKGKVK